MYLVTILLVQLKRLSSHVLKHYTVNNHTVTFINVICLFTDVTVVVINEKGEQLDEPMAMTEQPSTACSVPILLMPARGNDSAPAVCTSFVESLRTAALLYSPAIHSTPLPLTSKDVRGTVVSSSSSSNHYIPLPSSSVEVPATVASICSTPLPSTSVLDWYQLPFQVNCHQYSLLVREEK